MSAANLNPNDFAYLLGMIISSERPSVFTSEYNVYGQGLLQKTGAQKKRVIEAEDYISPDLLVFEYDSDDLLFDHVDHFFANLLSTQPEFSSTLNVHAFARGLYEHCGIFDGVLVWTSVDTPQLNIEISKELEKACWVEVLKRFQIPIKFQGRKEKVLQISKINVVDFLAKLYDTAEKDTYDPDAFEKYVHLISSSSLLRGSGDNSRELTIPHFKFARILPEAIIPTKARASDVGYDLSCVKVNKIISEKTIRYHTGIVVEAQYGWRPAIKLRSSATSKGHILANCEGIIDYGYQNELLIAVTKIDDSLSDLQLPFCITQLEFVPCQHFVGREVPPSYFEAIASSRGLKGFGSTENQTDAVGEQPLQ